MISLCRPLRSVSKRKQFRNNGAYCHIGPFLLSAQSQKMKWEWRTWEQVKTIAFLPDRQFPSVAIILRTPTKHPHPSTIAARNIHECTHVPRVHAHILAPYNGLIGEITAFRSDSKVLKVTGEQFSNNHPRIIFLQYFFKKEKSATEWTQ